MKITAKELRTRTREILDSVDRGESVTITYRGKDTAQLTSINKDENIHEKDQSNKLPVFGMWADRNDMTGVQQYLRRLRGPGDTTSLKDDTLLTENKAI